MPQKQKSHRKFEKCWNFLNCFYNRVFFSKDGKAYKQWPSLLYIGYIRGFMKVALFWGLYILCVACQKELFLSFIEIQWGSSPDIMVSWISLGYRPKKQPLLRPQILQKIEKNLGHREALGETTSTAHTLLS